jgi:hypothetical protein
LLTGGGSEGEIIREVILSASGNVDVNSKLPEMDEKYLKRFFGRRVNFSQGKKLN